ncbi:MAG: rhomboid family intramembrane serine protease [Lysobacterales bacterium CG17_big_fil_post_rev_8_21_14_2_50_64_11]|nr:MAG: rhomboid family intramembrane serine protease [Xanthomonadales bacterium CG17_big_fil_post_rev_8_21_14_2_50_64_11]
MNPMPPITSALLWANGIVFLLQSVIGMAAFSGLMLWPLGDYPLGGGEMGSLFYPWQLLTYGFLHGGIGHIFVNMLAVWMFGASLEYTWGPRRFLIYYLTCVAGAGVIQLLVATWTTNAGMPPYPTLGASGGVFGVLLGYGMLFPKRQVMLLIPPIPMQARTLVIVYGALSLFAGMTGAQPGIAHFAHLGGMLFGFGLIQYWRGRWPFDRRRRDGGAGPWRPH